MSIVSKAPASEDILHELHMLTAESFLAEIRRLKAEGEAIPPALLTSAAKFLKDNGVDRPVKPGDPEDLLNEELPELKDNVINFHRGSHG